MTAARPRLGRGPSIGQPLAASPLAAYETLVAGRWRPVLLKLESTHPSGSIKHRTAGALVRDARARSGDGADLVLVESTSGNLGVGIAMLCREVGMPFIAVVDPRIQPPKLDRMRRLGATIEMVRTPDADGSFLDARLARVAELCAADDRRWCPNQYDNWANPAVHRDTTAPEIARQTGGEVEWVVAAVSTGGTLRGVLDGFTRMGLRPRGLAVDAVGSRALGGPGGPRHMTGIGSSRRSSFLAPDRVARVARVGDAAAFAECWRFRHDTGVALGASSGAVLAAARQLLAEEEAGFPPICVAADGGEDYASTLYHRRWLREVGHEQAAAVPGPPRWRESSWPATTR